MIVKLVQRNMRIFFRDRMNVFFALLASLVMFIAYLFFLGGLQIDSIREAFPGAGVEAIQYFVNSWVFAGILTVTCVTTGLAALQVFVSDRVSGRFKDFAVSPIAKWKLVVGYLVSTIIISIIMTTAMLAISEIYIVTGGGGWLTWAQLFVVYGYLLLTTISFATISSFIATFIKTESAFSSLNVIVGTSIGFLAGIYVPIGTLPTSVANVINVLPFSQAASLIREPFTRDSLAAIASGKGEAITAVQNSYGISISVGDFSVTRFMIVCILLALAILFGGLAVWRLSRKIPS